MTFNNTIIKKIYPTLKETFLRGLERMAEGDVWI